MQSAFVKVLGKLPTGLSLDEVQPWFFTVVVNTAREKRRSDVRRHQREEQAMLTESEYHEQRGADREMVAALRRALGELDESERLPVVLCHEQGMTQASAAQVLGISPRLVSVHLAKALESLRGKLARAGITAVPAVIVAGLGQTAPAVPGSLGLAVQQLGVQAVQAVHAAGVAAGSGSGVASGATAVGVPGAVSFKLVAGAIVLALVVLAVVETHKRGAAAPTVNSAVGTAQPVATPPSVAPGAGRSVAAAPAAGGIGANEALQRILDTPFDAVYHRAYLSEVVDDLKNRFGLRSALPFDLTGGTWPAALDKTFVFTLDQKQVKVGEVLKRLAATGKLTLEYHGDTVVIWVPVDDQRLADLTKKLKTGDVEARCEAAYDLGNLGDKRIDPLLVTGLTDADSAVAIRAVQALTARKDTLAYGPSGKAVFEIVAKMLETNALPACTQELVELLGSSGDPRAVDRLATYVKSQDADVRRAVAEGLGATRDPRAWAQLNALLKDPRPEVRAHACKAAGALQEPKAVEPLLSQLRDPDGSVDEAAAEGLRQIASRDMDHALFTLLKGSKANRSYVVGALYFSRDPEVIDQLVPLLSGPDSFTVSAAASALSTIHDPRAVTALADLLKGKDRYGVQGWIAAELYARHDPRATAAKARQLKSDDSQVRITALNCLKCSGDPDLEPIVTAMLKDPDPTVRAYAAVALDDTDHSSAFASLVVMLHQPDPKVQTAAMSGMAESRDHRAVTALLSVAADAAADGDLRNQAVSALASLGDPSAVDPLLALWPHAGHELSEQIPMVLRYLNRSDDPKELTVALSELQAFLKPNDPVAWQIACCLGAWDDPRALAPLLVILKNTNPDLRALALQGLGSTRDPRVVAPLIALVNDSTAVFNVRYEAASVLVATQDPRALASVIALAKDADPKIRASVAGALGTAHDTRAIGPIIELTNDPDATVRAAAGYALVRCRVDDPRAVDGLIGLIRRASNTVVRSGAEERLKNMRDPRVDAAMAEAMAQYEKRQQDLNRPDEF
ncbi:MAG: sigma-70 family RNA polymerase sigma factor [Planctomycetota bacterium]